MRILITTDVAGGVWSYTEELATGLTTRGHEIVLVILGRATTLGQKERELSHEKIEILRLPCPLEWEPGTSDELERSVEVLREIVARTSPDVVHLNQFFYGAYELGAPRLIVAHSDVVSWWRNVKGREPPDGPWIRRYKRWVRDGLHGAHSRVAPSRWSAWQTAALHGGGLFRIIHNARSPNRFRRDHAKHKKGSGTSDQDRTGGRSLKTANERHNEGGPLVVAAGRLWDEAKGVRDLIPVAERLRDHARIVLAGEARHPAGGTDFPTDTPGLEWRGRLESAKLHELLARSQIYVATSRYEPFGLAPLEAALAGCALVLSDIPTFRELWDGCAVFYPPGDTGALERSLLALLGDDQRRETLAERSRSRALERYAPERMAAEYESLYLELIHRYAREPVVAD